MIHGIVDAEMLGLQRFSLNAAPHPIAWIKRALHT
jgi:hypothetical protein